MHHTLDKYDKQNQEEGSEIPHRANFIATVNHIRDIFETKGLPYGFLGSFEMLCLGQRRHMSDIHVAYDDKDFARIKLKLQSNKRFHILDGINPLLPSKVLVHTGPAYKDKDCSCAAVIEVTLLPPGSLGTPLTGRLRSNLVLLTLKSNGKPTTYKGLNMPSLVNTLIHLCTVSGPAWNPKKDILFLCRNYSTRIKAVQQQLDSKAIWQNFFTTSFFSQLSQEDQCACFQTLSDRRPPSWMKFILPPQEGEMRSQSNFAQTRPSVAKNESSVEQSVAGLPGCPLPERLSSQPSHPKTTVFSSVEPAATRVSSYHPAVSITRPTEVPESNKNSRSRYYQPGVCDSQRISLRNGDSIIEQRPGPSHNIKVINSRRAELSSPSYDLGQPHMHEDRGQRKDSFDPYLRSLDRRYSDAPSMGHQEPKKSMMRGFDPSEIYSQQTIGRVSPAHEAAYQHLPYRLAGMAGSEGLHPAPLRPQPSSPIGVPETKERVSYPVVDSKNIVASLIAHTNATLNSYRYPSSTRHEQSSLDSVTYEALSPRIHHQPKRVDSSVSLREPCIEFAPCQNELGKEGEEEEEEESGKQLMLAHTPNNIPSQTLPPSLIAGVRKPAATQPYLSQSVEDFLPFSQPCTHTPKDWSDARSFQSSPTIQSGRRLTSLAPSPAYKAYRPISHPIAQLASPTNIQAVTLTGDDELESASRRRFEDLRNVDEKHRFLHERMHKHDLSIDNIVSLDIHDSLRLANDYRLGLPAFDEGYVRTETRR